jgi:hypothetical protein
VRGAVRVFIDEGPSLPRSVFAKSLNTAAGLIPNSRTNVSNMLRTKGCSTVDEKCAETNCSHRRTPTSL